MGSVGPEDQWCLESYGTHTQEEGKSKWKCDEEDEPVFLGRRHCSRRVKFSQEQRFETRLFYVVPVE